ncbi:SIR2 family protein [Acinetobacter pittii]|uniref:SIR2 family protein n=1 Tax=Acinetobacter pittii TaxID=48296 RepID=UPI0021CD1F4B|nr:SIR2 family protein [Acinetobacter pittii]MCU4708328.1 SIR2 family protein [Acinetobacter pittii]
MDIFDFINNYKNHPVLFIGTGFSLRYLSNSYSWEGLLKKIAFELKGNNEFFHDLKGQVYDRRSGTYDFMRLASLLQEEFNNQISADRNGKFKEINDEYYNKSDEGITSDKFKIYISKLLNELNIKEEKREELEVFNLLSKNISSIITTNYDNLIEVVTEFDPLVGNNILLSNPYGSVYKIHGSVENPEELVFTSDDYSEFDQRYDLIRAQLISLFVHNPIVFIGYSVNDVNIKKILSTIYKYVQLNSTQAELIRNNFLLVEYQEGSDSLEILDRDIDVDGNTLRINKLKTDNYIELYRALESLSLPVSTYEIRRVLDNVKDITSGGTIKVSIADDIDQLKNSERILAISPKSKPTIEYTYTDSSQLIIDYFEIIDNKSENLVKLIDEFPVSRTHWFPIFGFANIVPDLFKAETLKTQQRTKLANNFKTNMSRFDSLGLKNINEVLIAENIPESYKIEYIFYKIYNNSFDLDDLKEYLLKINGDLDSNYKKLLCLYDFKKYEN